jgi:hypothetical protein
LSTAFPPKLPLRPSSYPQFIHRAVPVSPHVIHLFRRFIPSLPTPPRLSTHLCTCLRRSIHRLSTYPQPPSRICRTPSSHCVRTAACHAASWQHDRNGFFYVPVEPLTLYSPGFVCWQLPARRTGFKRTSPRRFPTVHPMLYDISLVRAIREATPLNLLSAFRHKGADHVHRCCHGSGRPPDP